MIITNEMVRNAIEITRPAALSILRCPDSVWGPKWVVGRVQVPSGFLTNFMFGKKLRWNPSWGKEIDFWEIAIKKLDLCQREKKNSSTIVSEEPWILKRNEYLYAGGVFDSGFTAAVSGAKGWADETIASILVQNIKMLAHLETDHRIANGQMQI